MFTTIREKFLNKRLQYICFYIIYLNKENKKNLVHLITDIFYNGNYDFLYNYHLL